MAKVIFSMYEMVYNKALIGEVIYPDENDPTLEETIQYVKAKKDIRTIYIHCVSGEVYPMDTDGEFEFEVNNENVWKAPTKKKIKKRR